MSENAFQNLMPPQRGLLDKLLDYDVRFIVVGGYAVRSHGFFRDTRDLDILVDTDPKNADLILGALKTTFGSFDVPSVLEKLTKPGNKVSITGIDILTDLNGRLLDDYQKNIILVNSRGVHVPVIGLTDLIDSKQSELADCSDPDRVSSISKDLSEIKRIQRTENDADQPN